MSLQSFYNLACRFALCHAKSLVHRPRLMLLWQQSGHSVHEDFLQEHLAEFAESCSLRTLQHCATISSVIDDSTITDGRWKLESDCSMMCCSSLHMIASSGTEGFGPSVHSLGEWIKKSRFGMEVGVLAPQPSSGLLLSWLFLLHLLIL